MSIIPEAVVVDTVDGYVYTNAGTFTLEAARKFADSKNAHCKPEYRTYRVFKLVPDEAAPHECKTSRLPGDSGYFVYCPRGCNLGSSALADTEQAAKVRAGLHRSATTILTARKAGEQ